MVTFSRTMPAAICCYPTMPRPRTPSAKALRSHDASFCREAVRSSLGSIFQHYSLSPKRHTRDHRGVGVVIRIDVTDKVLGRSRQHTTCDSPFPVSTPQICAVLGRAPRGGLCDQSRDNSGVWVLRGAQPQGGASPDSTSRHITVHPGPKLSSS